MDPAADGRPAIKGRQEDRVWDFLSLSGTSDGDTFTRHPHLTLGLGAQTVEAMVTVPNAVNSTMRSNIVRLGPDGFRALAREVLQTLAPLLHKHPGAKPWFRGVQRRYPSQSAKPHLDAAIEFDLRTAVPSSGLPKSQPRWLDAAYGSFVDKRGRTTKFKWACSSATSIARSFGGRMPSPWSKRPGSDASLWWSWPR